jgi:maleylacetoacetate isomerase
MCAWRKFDLDPENATLRLYSYWRSSASWRVRWALHFKAISFEVIPVNLLRAENLEPAHLRRNPGGALPVLDLGEGRYLTESMAIIEWIEEVYSLKGPSLFPGSAFERAKIRELTEVINSGTAPLQIPKIQKAYSEDPAKRSEWAKKWIHSGLTQFDHLSRDFRRTFSVGDSLSVADLFLIPQVYNAIRYEIQMDREFPQLFEIYKRCRQLESCKKSDPESQVDAPPESHS